MNLPGNGASTGDKKLSSAKATLNPNATEFVPFALRSRSAGITIPDTSSKSAATPVKSILDRSESSVSNKSDEEAQQYWRHQLPDDITPDFNVMGLDDTQGINSLSLTDANELSRFSGLSPQSLNGNGYTEKLRNSVSPYGEYPSPRGFQPSLAKPWDKEIVNNDQVLARDGHLYNGNSRLDFFADMSNEQLLVDNEDVSPLEFLASQFPGFAAESLTEVYFANGGDLNLTIEMLTQLEELQFDEALNHTPNSETFSTPNLNALDFPALSVTDGQNGLAKFSGDDHQSVSSYRSPKRIAHFYSDLFHPFQRVGPQTLPQLGIYGNTVQNRGSAHASPVWLETGEAVANMYSEMRGEARDHARVRNSYFEQARQAYLIGNKALAKELSIKGQVHNMQMKAAHEKAQDSIYRQRNTEMQANGRERMIDLHGLHVSEAIHVLKRELAVLKNAARSAGQHFLAYICVGTGHHTRGSRTPARLPTAIQRYLLEEEGLDYSEPQPGLLRVVIF
ncbi:hypothetical protein DH2020_046585 [Rehmannia glutinosa]|uniref:Smr domain-containing protein n=1 Tax=Rehmannia glutinosa TaxID=99300 RepID=A0ABR0UAS1_REHGL